MAAQPAFDDLEDEPASPFERTFVRAVLEHRGLFHAPSAAEYRQALEVLRQFREQCAGHPPRSTWEPDVGEETFGELRAKIFLLFGTTRPTASQWHRAHTALFGPLLCESCG